MHPPSPDYVPEPEHPPSLDYVPSPKHPPLPAYVPYVLEPAYPEFMPPEDDVLLAKEQPLPAAVSPTVNSPRYITESDPKEDLEEDDEDPKKDPADYPTDRDDNEEEEESSKKDADDEDEDEDEDKKEKEEHLAPADSVPPLHASPTYPLGYRAVIIWVDVFEVTLPLRKRLYIAIGPRFEVEKCSSTPTARPTRGFRADYGFVGTLDDKIRRDPDRKIGYRITDVWDDPDEIANEIPTTDVAELSQRVTDFVTNVRDRRSHARTARLMESEARASREAWVQSMDSSDMARFETQMAALQSQQRPARDPAHPDVPEEAGMYYVMSVIEFIMNECRFSYTIVNFNSDVYFTKIAPKRTTISSPDTTTTTTTLVTDAWLKALIDQGVADALAACDADRSRNGEDSHDSRIGTVGHDVTYTMTWKNLKKSMIDKYRPRGEIKKLEVEMWNLKVKGTDVVSYNQCFQELASMYARMFPKESNKIERSLTNAKTSNNQRGTGAGQKATCFECEAHGHFKRECPKMKNNNLGNQGGNGNAPAKVYVVGNAGTNSDSNVVTGTFLLNNRYVTILFDTGADRSFLSTAFISQIDITPTTLDHYYDVELADGRIVGLNNTIRGLL
nr:putative reverse transcriptase domain-containing protein [Tanacetum cinerariifolium]